MCDQIRIKEVKIIEVDIKEIIEMIIMKEVGGGLGKDNIQVIPEGMTEVIVGLDHNQQPVPTETELDAINVGNMIMLLRTVQLQKQKKKQNKYNRCIIWMMNRQH